MQKTLRQKAAKELLARKKARRNYLEFIKYCWWMPHELAIGPHTEAISQRLTQAVDDYREGLSSFLCIMVPFRHGKSDLVSRAFVPYFLGRAQDLSPDVVMTGYGAELVTSFSRASKRIINSVQYRSLFPDVQLSLDRNSAGKWGITGSQGEVLAVGLGGSITGHGGDLIVVDDYCKKREEAESETYRERVWDTFTNDIMTRRAPTSIVVIAATPWHVDDLFGRINNEMDSNDEFPEFEFLKFPARTEDGGNLFSERFNDTWYASQRASLGSYAASAMLDCDPTTRSGAILNVEGIQWYNNTLKGIVSQMRWIRFWDLASTERQRIKSDPDYTVGTLGSLVTDRDGLLNLYCEDVVYGQLSSTRRDNLIENTAMKDGPGVIQYIECVGGYKDTYTRMRDKLHGKRIVKPFNVTGAKGDKVARASCLEPIFDSGNVHFRRGPWNEFALKHLREFPLGLHDDFVDTVSGIGLILQPRTKRRVKARQ